MNLYGSDGDTLVAHGVDRITFRTPRDVQQVFKYPDYPPGAEVTFVQINIEQDYDKGRAYVTKGGIGYRNIEVVVEAYGTTVFGYELYIFGYR